MSLNSLPRSAVALVFFCGFVLSGTACADGAGSHAVLPPYQGPLDRHQPGSVGWRYIIYDSPWEEEAEEDYPPYTSVRDFPWRDCVYFFNMHGGPGFVEVRDGSTEFANGEGFDLYVLDIEFADVNDDGMEEAIVLTRSFFGSTARTDIGVFTLDPKLSRFAYLAVVIPGALGGSPDSPGHVEKIDVMDGAVIVYRYQGAVKPPVGYEPVGSHYRIETWHWDGEKMVEDENQAYTEQIPERFAWPDYGAWCRDPARDGYEQDTCEKWLSR